VVELDTKRYTAPLPVVDAARSVQGAPSKSLGYGSAAAKTVDEFSSGDVHSQH
jgi:hypothetical protein